MKFLILLGSVLISAIYGDISQFERAVLDRNGDVFVLITMKNQLPIEAPVGLYRFRKLDNYAPTRLGVSNQPGIENYEGLAVDKFGHVKFFRNQGDGGSLVELLNVNTTHPDSTNAYPGTTSYTYDERGGGPCFGSGRAITVNGTPPGWVYVVENNGDSGWFQLYDVAQTKGLSSASTNAWQYSNDRSASFPAGTRFLPPAFNAISTDSILPYHNGFWREDCQRHRYAINFGNGAGVYPPMNGFFLTPTPSGVCVHANCLRGVRISSVVKNQSSLFLDEYMSEDDNKVLQDLDAGVFGNAVKTKFAMVDGVDFNIASSANSAIRGRMRPSTKAINSSLSFSPQVFRYNVCGDMCGQDGVPQNVPPVTINKGRAKFSSGGANQAQQRSYMVKTSTSLDGTSVSTWVVKLSFDASRGEYDQDDIINWTGGSSVSLGPGEIAGDGVLSPRNLSMAPKRIIIYDLPGNPDYIRTVQTSKREFTGETPPDTKDYIYVSNVAPSHFTVSSSFWGTGGVVWYADSTANPLKLYFEQINHETGAVLADGTTNPILANNASPLMAMGADGDNFVYLLHLGTGTDGSGGVEGVDEMNRLLTPLTATRINQLCIEGRLSACPSFPYTVVPGTSQEVGLRVKIFAGAMVEKIAPIPGSTPVKVGVLPLEDTGAECNVLLDFRDSNLDGLTEDQGSYKNAWTCDAAQGAAATVQDRFNFELAVVNVANPPATAGRFNLDIVAQQGSGAVAGGVSAFEEDIAYNFYMENPPLFNGIIAQLGLSNDPQLNIFADVSTISNFEDAGTNLVKAMVQNLGVYDYFFDDDGREGVLLPSFIKKPGLMLGDQLHSNIGAIGSGSSSQSNLRYRWRVIARTPPHSFKDYGAAPCEPLLKNGSGATLINKDLLKDSGFLDASYQELPYSSVGVLHDTCWQDLEDADPAGVPTDMFDPAALSFTFWDPGLYDVVLYFGGTRFNADEKTFLDLASSINAEVAVTWYAMEIPVGARVAQTATEIREVVISNNYLANNQETRTGIYPNGDDTITAHTLATDASLEGGDLSGPEGRFPVFPVANFAHSQTPLVVTWEGQRTPIVAEADIQFFRLADLRYETLGEGLPDKWVSGALTTDDLQTKYHGVGSWDYSYPAGNGAAIQIGSFNFQPLNKTGTHPSNWSSSPSQTGFKIVTDSWTPAEERRGYDASGDYETGRGYQSSGAFVTAAGADEQFQAAHQGTLSSDDSLPASINSIAFAQDLISNPEAFYTWWEIKYAWFMRFTKPDGTVHKKIIKTGNLAEIFLLNLMAPLGSGWDQLVKNIAPYNLVAEGNGVPTAASPLLQYLGNNADEHKRDRKIHLRIPLFNPGAILDSSDVETEMHQPIRSFSFADNFANLYSQIHPLAFQVPTEPTLIEIGFQLFYPTMHWEGRDELSPGSGAYRYYDAVYWGPASAAAGVHQAVDFTQIPLNFGSDSFQAWPILATQRVLDLSSPGLVMDVDASALGMELSDLQTINGKLRVDGGFRPSGTGDDMDYIAPGNRIDHFVDLVVLDSKAPRMKTVKGRSVTATTGGHSTGAVVLEVTENNPYALWDSFEMVGNAGLNTDPDDRLRVPGLVQFSYEMGYDPRTLFGVGLKTANAGVKGERAYGFNLSFTSLQTIQTQITNDGRDLPAYDLTLAGLAKPAIETVPGYVYNPQRITATDFTYPWKTPSNGYPSDGVFTERRTQVFQGLPVATDNPSGTVGNRQSRDRINDNAPATRIKYYPPLQSITNTKDTDVRTQDPTVKHPGLNAWLVNLVPDLQGEAPFYLQPDHSDGQTRVEFLDENPSAAANDDDDYARLDSSCLNSVSPIYADPDNCSIRTRWRVQGQFLEVPFFVNGSQPQSDVSSLTFNIYAKARDVRILKPMDDFDSSLNIDWTSPGSDWFKGNFNSNWPKFDFALSWRRVMGMENYGESGSLGSLGQSLSDSVAQKIDRYYDNELQRRATRVAMLQVSDNDAPNFRVTLMEFKYNRKVEYTVMSAQGVNASSNLDSDRVVIFRTEDKRDSQNPLFDSIHTYEEFDEATYSVGGAGSTTARFAINVIEPSTADQHEALHIPEDVRFMIKVEATDNRDLDEISITIRSAIDGLAVFTPDLASVRHISTDPGSHAFPERYSSSGRIYQQAKILTGYHLYANANFYDVIQVDVSDQSGNRRILDIPVIVIGQGVHFRQLGDQTTTQ
jgi:hypothetical protein